MTLGGLLQPSVHLAERDDYFAGAPLAPSTTFDADSLWAAAHLDHIKPPLEPEA